MPILHQDLPRGSAINSYGCPHQRGTRRRAVCRECKAPKEKRWQTEPPFYTFRDLFAMGAR